jgi:putative ABC transport system substrate-binding protein
MLGIRRREFISFVGGATAAWPLAALAQQSATPVIGYLHSGSFEARNVAAFLKGLSDVGFVEGRNLSIEYRAAHDQYDLLPELAADLVRRRVSLIYAGGGTVAVSAAKAATQTIPIVFAMGGDPVARGFVTSFNRPGGNVTGVSFLSYELGPKRIGLLNELVPGASRYALLFNPVPETESSTAELRGAAARIGKQIEVFTARNVSEIDTAFADLVRRGAEALVVSASSLFNTRRVQLATLAAYYRLPASYDDRRAVEVGGLMSYGASFEDAFRQAGIYVGRILKGEKPANLPVMQPTKFDLVINLTTAKVLGLTVPDRVLAIADEIIE